MKRLSFIIQIFIEHFLYANIVLALRIQWQIRQTKIPVLGELKFKWE